ncbi:methyltransferase, partial [Variovorax sp. KK3]
MQTLPVASRPAAPSWRAAWGDRWLALRDRLLSSRAFQRRAAAFAPTRPIAQQRAAALFDLVAGFVYSQVLLACVELGLFDSLARGPMTLGDIAHQADLPSESAERLLAAAVALRLLERRSGGRFGLGELGAPMVDNTALAALVAHHRALYADLADPVALLRSGSRETALARYWPYAGAARPEGLPLDSVAGYSALMAASQPLVCDEILDAYPLHGHRCLLDVGGGEGSFVIGAAAHAPSLRLMLFDLPAVAERARRRCAAAGIGERVRIEGGSFLADALPEGADIATLVRVIHDHDDASALCILSAVRRALPRGGT